MGGQLSGADVRECEINFCYVYVSRKFMLKKIQTKTGCMGWKNLLKNVDILPKHSTCTWLLKVTFASSYLFQL